MEMEMEREMEMEMENGKMETGSRSRSCSRNNLVPRSLVGKLLVGPAQARPPVQRGWSWGARRFGASPSSLGGRRAFSRRQMQGPGRGTKKEDPPCCSCTTDIDHHVLIAPENSLLYSHESCCAG